MGTSLCVPPISLSWGWHGHLLPFQHPVSSAGRPRGGSTCSTWGCDSLPYRMSHRSAMERILLIPQEWTLEGSRMTSLKCSVSGTGHFILLHVCSHFLSGHILFLGAGGVPGRSQSPNRWAETSFLLFLVPNPIFLPSQRYRSASLLFPGPLHARKQSREGACFHWQLQLIRGA